MLCMGSQHVTYIWGSKLRSASAVRSLHIMINYIRMLGAGSPHEYKLTSLKTKLEIKVRSASGPPKSK